MANKPNKYLTDKQIRELPVGEKRYKVVVGEPKELYVRVNPSGKKVFFVKYKLAGREIVRVLQEFRPGIYEAKLARKDANEILRCVASGKNPDELVAIQNGKYLFKNLFKTYIEMKSVTLSEGYLKKVTDRHKKYTIPSLGDKDAKEILQSDLFAILNGIFNPNNPRSRLESVHKLINELKQIFDIAYKDGYIARNPADGLHSSFPSVKRFNRETGKEGHFKSIVDLEILSEFFDDLRKDADMNLQTKRALFLQIYTANRPGNTVKARWRDIDLDKRIWTIPAKEMKMRYPHRVALSEQAIAVLKEQKLFSGNHEFVFPSEKTETGHITTEGLGKALKRLGGGKYSVTPHGFRATFRTICTINLAQLNLLGLSNKTIETALAHQENDQVVAVYERTRATDEQLIALMQWYGDFLSNLPRAV